MNFYWIKLKFLYLLMKKDTIIDEKKEECKPTKNTWECLWKDQIAEKLNTIVPMQLTADEEKSFQEATHCCICKNNLYRKRVHDHCHLSGAYRGPAHINCNLNYRQPKSIQVIFHNSKNYDTRHLMSSIGKLQNYHIQIIPNTMEKYIAFSLIKNIVLSH